MADIVFDYGDYIIPPDDKFVNWGSIHHTFNRQINYRHIQQQVENRLSQVVKKVHITDDKKLEYVLGFDQNELEDFFEQIVNQINDKVEEVVRADEFLAVRTEVRSHSKIFEGKTVEGKEYSEFIQSIGKALNFIDENLKKSQEWENFIAAYAAALRVDKKSRTGVTKKQKDAIADLDKIVKSFNEKDLTDGQKALKNIMEYLANIPKKMIEDGKRKEYNSRRMGGTLNNILDTTIGEYLSMISVDLVTKGQRQVEKGLSQATGHSSVTSLINPASKVPAKPDSSKPGVFFSVYKNGEERIIQCDLNISVKWANIKTEGKNDPIQIQSINNYVKLAQKVFGDNTQSNYAIYNTLAFSNVDKFGADAEKAYRLLRTGILSKYAIDFLMGTGEDLIVENKAISKNTATFIMINGKVYSTFSIMMAFIEDMKKHEKAGYGNLDTSNSIIYMSAPNRPSKKEAEKPEYINDKTLTLYTQEMRNYIDKFAVTVKLNPGKLSQLAKSKINSVKPIN